MISRTFARSFAGGEIDPDLHARVDLGKYQTGLKTASNFMVLPQGPVTNRPGTRMCGTIPANADHGPFLIPFTFSATQTYVLALANSKMWFYSNGGPIVQAATGFSYTFADNRFNSTAHGYSTGDLLYITANVPSLGNQVFDGRLCYVTVIDSNNYRVSDSLGLTPLAGTSNFAGNAAKVVVISTPWFGEEVFDLHYAQNADVMTLCHPNYAPRELRRTSATTFTLTTIDFQPTVKTPTSPTATPAGPGGGTPVTYYYKVTATSADGREESAPTAIISAAQDLTIAGNTINIQATTATFTPPSTTTTTPLNCNVYKAKDGVFGFVGSFLAGTDVTMGATPFKDNNVTPDITRQPPVTANNPFGTSGNYPRAVAYFEQRRCFAGTTNTPQGVWMTKQGTEGNFIIGVPVAEDDPLIFNVASRDANTINHLVPTSALLALTTTTELRISNPNGGPVSASGISVRPDTYIGASNVQPVVTSNSVLFVGAYDQHVWELRYDFQAQGYKVNDLSILAPHLFEGYRIVQLAYTRAINRTLWAVRDDGALLACTYVPEHEIWAWSVHHLGGSGLVRSIAAVLEGTTESLYLSVHRTAVVGGLTYIFNAIERILPRRPEFVPDADDDILTFDSYFLDQAYKFEVTVTSDPDTAIISRLHYLEGKVVWANVRGRVYRNLTVANGQITLPVATREAIVGYQYDCDMETLPLALEGVQGAGVAQFKSVSDVHLRVRNTVGLEVGPAFDDLVAWKQETGASMGKPIPPHTGVIEVVPNSTWDRDATVCVRHREPTPATIQSIVTTVSADG